MWMIPFLICFPFVVSILMFTIRVNKIRNTIAYISAGTIMAATGILRFSGLRADASRWTFFIIPTSLIRLC